MEWQLVDLMKKHLQYIFESYQQTIQSQKCRMSVQHVFTQVKRKCFDITQQIYKNFKVKTVRIYGFNILSGAWPMCIFLGW